MQCSNNLFDALDKIINLFENLKPSALKKPQKQLRKDWKRFENSLNIPEEKQMKNHQNKVRKTQIEHR